MWVTGGWLFGELLKIDAPGEVGVDDQVPVDRVGGNVPRVEAAPMVPGVYGPKELGLSSVGCRGPA